MLKGFEQETDELNAEEMAYIPALIEGFKNHGEDDPIKAPEIVVAMNQYLVSKGASIRMTEPRLRKMVHHIRSCGLLPLMATSKGYFVSYNMEVIKNQVESLKQRANSIRTSAEGLEKFIMPKTANP
jgi:hypothetical protein